MNEIVTIVIAMLAVYGFYAVLYEIKRMLLKIAWRRDEKIDKSDEMEYNKKNE